MSYFPLQTIVFPSIVFGAPEEMYVRFPNEKAFACFSEKKIIFGRFGCANFDTYFNGFSIGRWKAHCDIQDLKLLLRGSGRFVLKFGLHRHGHAHRWISEHHVNLQNGSDSLICIPISEIDDGLLYFSITSIEEDASLEDARYVLDSIPGTSIKIGIVITHFNRKQYVLPAVHRISEELLNDEIYRGKIELVIVDNSRNIELNEVDHVTLLPNENFGGSGGFTRGLLHLEDNGSFTHCLFMDDDATCEIESIRRTFALLSLAKARKLAVAGGLLRQIEPYRLFEKGALFDRYCCPLKGGLDLCQVGSLIEAEIDDVHPHYGAWWFFAFALKDVEFYPFPFFVRGDDVAFSIMNKFNILTMNGISTWGEDFSLKSGPLPLYFDLRSLILINMMFFKRDLKDIKKLVCKLFKRQINSYNYASAAAISLALEHVMQGPEFWKSNIDISKIRNQIQDASICEKMHPIDIADYKIRSGPRPRLNYIARRIRKISRNGFLLPIMFLRDETVVQLKSFQGDAREIYGYRRVLYFYAPLRMGYIAVHDKILYFQESRIFKARMKRFVRAFDNLRTEYAAASISMTSREFWRRIYTN